MNSMQPLERRILDFTREPQAEFLRRLLFALRDHAARLLLVVRDEPGLSKRGTEFLSMLEADLIERRRGRSWPGTVLLAEDATIFEFAPTDRVVSVIAAASAGLYGWQQPELPEDPALLRADGSAILATIAHEGDAYLELGEEEMAELMEVLPELAQLTRPHASEP